MADCQPAGSDNQSYFKKEEEEEVQEEDDQNLDDDGPSPFLIHIRGLPWTTTKQEICDFFAGVNIVNGENGIHIITCAMNNSRPLGEAYIELVSNDDLELALTFDRKNLGKRYIEVFKAQIADFELVMSKQENAQKDNVLRLRGLPWDTEESEIADFFKGLRINEESIHIHYDKTGRASGEAYVQFQTCEDCEEALKRNMEKIGSRYIELFRSTQSELQRSIAKTTYARNRNNSKRMHPYERNGNGANNRQNNRNMRGNNDRRGQMNDMNIFDNFNRQSFNSGNSVGRNNFGGNSFNDNSQLGSRFQQRNQNSFDDDNSRFINNFGNGSMQFMGNDNFNANRSFNDLIDFTSDNIERDFRNDGRNFGNGGSLFNRNNDTNRFNDNRFGNNSGQGNDFNRFGGGGDNSSNNSFRNGNDSTIDEMHCIQMRGLPYYSDEMDIFNFFHPIQPALCKVLVNKSGKHSGEAKAYFSSYEDAREAMRRDKEQMGSRYIELFYGGRHGGGGNGNGNGNRKRF